MPKRKQSSSLPVMPDLEVVDGLTLHRGGPHGYKKLKFSKKEGGYQGCNVGLKLYTKRHIMARDAALELAQKEKDHKLGTKLSIGAPKQTSPPPAARG